MSGQVQMPEPPKEFILSADALNRVFEIINNDVPTGAGNKMMDAIRKGIKPYEAPKPPKK